MSSYNVKRRSNKSGEIRKGQYYVWYLGWKECRGLAGREYTEPIVKDLVLRRKHEDLPKLTIEVSQKELKIYQLIKSSKFGRTEKAKFPTVPSKDVTYASQGLPPDADVVACIYLGYNPTTRRAVHVHVYRCDSPETASVFVEHLNDIMRIAEHQDRIADIEDQLAEKGEITPRPRNFINSFDADSVVTRTPSTVHTRPDNSIDDLSDDDSDSGNPQSPFQRPTHYEEDVFDKEKEMNMETLANELKHRLGSRSNAPILLPPQDYDTVRRVRGNLNLEDQLEYESRKCKNEDIVGQNGSKHNSLNLFDMGSSKYDSGHGQGSESSDGRSGGSSQEMYKQGKRISIGSDDARLGGTGVSAPEHNEIHAVSPRWKAQHQIYSPPGRPVSPHPISPRAVSDRADSHTSSGSRPLSPRRTRSPSPNSRMVYQMRSPSPGLGSPYGVYGGERSGREMNTSRAGEQQRHRSSSRGRYMDAPPMIDVHPNRFSAGDYRGLPKQQSLEERYSSLDRNDQYRGQNRPDLSQSMPATALKNYTQQAASQERKDKKANKDRKKKKKPEREPPPDYTLHPAPTRRPAAVYS